MYGCETWTIKKAECQRVDAFKLWCWRRLLRFPWTSRRLNQSILQEISPECSLKLSQAFFTYRLLIVWYYPIFLRWSEVTQSCMTLQPRGLWPTRLLQLWDSPGKNTGVGCHFLLQEIFPTQGSSPGIEPGSLALEADASNSEPPGKPIFLR